MVDVVNVKGVVGVVNVKEVVGIVNVKGVVGVVNVKGVVGEHLHTYLHKIFVSKTFHNCRFSQKSSWRHCTLT